MTIQHPLQTIGIATLALALSSAVYAGPKPHVNVNRTGLAVKGYDVVAYVTDGRPVEGRPEFETSWNGAKWRFSSADHRDVFLRNPDNYAPQFGGYCSWAVSRGYTADIDPAAWRVVDGKLYLNYSKSVQTQWSEDIPGNIARAKANWPAVLDR